MSSRRSPDFGQVGHEFRRIERGAAADGEHEVDPLVTAQGDGPLDHLRWWIGHHVLEHDAVKAGVPESVLGSPGQAGVADTPVGHEQDPLRAERGGEVGDLPRGSVLEEDVRRHLEGETGSCGPPADQAGSMSGTRPRSSSTRTRVFSL